MRFLGYYIFFILMLACMATAKTSIAQENCYNGIDDDSDNLIDLHDPECQCRYNIQQDILQNGSFENYDHCPIVYSYDEDYNNVLAWEFASYTNINEATFFHNLKCSYDSGLTMLYMPPKLPLPDGSGLIAIRQDAYINTAVPEKEMAKTYISQCLQQPLKKNEEYVLSFNSGRFRSHDNYIGKIFPYTVAVFGNANCGAVPFGKKNALGNGCPANYNGWVLLGKVTVNVVKKWAQNRISFKAPFDVNVIAIGPDCSILAPIVDQADSTTFLDYHLYYLDDVHLLPANKFPYEYATLQIESSCSNKPVLQAPGTAGAKYQWYKDSIAIAGAVKKSYEVVNVNTDASYNVVVTNGNQCTTSEPYFITPSKINDVHIPADTTLCANDTILLAPQIPGISYTLNNQNFVRITIDNPGTYSITATDALGCKKTFTTIVTKQNCSSCDAEVPTAFTPNGDGLNDVFKPRIRCRFTQYKCAVYNRWGRKVYENSDINKSWNGSGFGQGTYVYLITYKTVANIVKTFKGTVTLIL